jgi:hypothetical protein
MVSTFRENCMEDKSWWCCSNTNRKTEDARNIWQKFADTLKFFNPEEAQRVCIT